MADWVLGVIGGSGLYEIPGLTNRRWEAVEGPWGAPSDELLFGEIDGIPVRFLPRHGRGHRVSPTHINARANIDALKRAGCTDIVSLSAVGSLKKKLAPGWFVVVDQYIDRTFAREKSFFGEGVVAHVSMAHPVCPRLSKLAAEAAEAAGAPVHEGGTYLCMEGPQFSTLAESELYRDWGAHVIGMTNMPEAKLAREAELPYASIAMVTDYDCWHADHAHVEVADIVRVMHDNADKAKATVANLCALLKDRPRKPSPIDTCLDAALITPPAHRDPALVAKLDAVAGRLLGGRPPEPPPRADAAQPPPLPFPAPAETPDIVEPANIGEPPAAAGAPQAPTPPTPPRRVSRLSLSRWRRRGWRSPIGRKD